VERRLEFIEFRLLWESGVNRADLIDTFGISVPQASKDLALYQEQAPGNVVYDKSAKRYVASEGFKPLFLDGDPDAYFSRLRSLTEGSTDPVDSWLAQAPAADVAVTPKRGVDGHVLRTILAAIRDMQSVEILYQSMNKARPQPGWRRITPHALGYDGLRWHVRAFSHGEGSYRDFLLPRALQVRAPGVPGGSAENDQLWHRYFKLEIAPHPALTPSQKRVVAKDYGMAGGKRVIPVRHAMLFYVLKRLNLLNDPEREDPRQQHIVVLNKDEVRQALQLADWAQQGSTGAARGNEGISMPME
jgi:predicted DNA-binding transcriptional regulator YafY